jgi:lauroyl/myristoyl acyltransferase/ADP-heptose:LPS heptosyltransferase
VIYCLLSIIGCFFALLPVRVVAVIARGAGWLVFRFGGSRSRVALSNLHHAFPEKSEEWRRKIALESCRRMVEMGFFVLASPHLSVKRLRRMFSAHESLIGGPVRIDAPGVPEVLLTPHFSMMESLTMMRVICAGLRQDVEAGIFYRPFGSAGVERWVKKSRERFGFKLLSRRAGFAQASALLRANQRVDVLFDQHTATAGTLCLFFGRLALTTELPGLLAARHRAGVGVCYTERTGFWRGVIRYAPLFPPPQPGQPPLDHAQVTIAANQWLEKELRSNDSQCADWLWLHRRWKVSAEAGKRFQIPPTPRDIVAQNLEELGLPAIPRRERFWIWLPRDLPGALASVPLLQALRASRADAELTLIMPEAFTPLFEGLKIAEHLVAPPPCAAQREAFFRRLRTRYPDTCVLLDTSPHAAREARLTGAPQRFGIRTAGNGGRNLTHAWTPPDGTDLDRLRRSRLWELWWKDAHGLAVAPDFRPFRLRGVPSSRRETRPIVGLAADAGHARPNHRWPDEHWRSLVRIMVLEHGVTVRVHGPPCAWARFAPLSRELPENSLENRTRKPDSAGVADTTASLAECACLAGRPSGGLPHLANLLGIPVVVLYGTENPFPDAPTFAAPVAILQPKDCPSPGAIPVSGIEPRAVATACSVFLG